MERISLEQGLALIKKHQIPNLKGLDLNDRTALFEVLMQDHQYAYHFEASTTEPSYYGANRSRLLLEEIIPEIEKLGKRPIYYYFILLSSPDARIMMDDLDALAAFIHANESTETVWTLHENDVDGPPNTITMHLIAIMD